ncbi:restriction endonuclease subunit S [Providencia burhodogranariea]|uniref:Restriction modification system DNA specificity subunit n=1 Tax=Providencia burhodogranariea DSM 19968 TaxID=1141662 RepID=K8X4Z3_9GAMM|nr:restriction endonuclease subunit S [Providencia burhodogranariea]EKT64752.1 restriction modification system DNA specificity subunit [Providencia burhodogranariea DSM 19968]
MSVEVTETGLNLIPAGYKQTEVGVIPEDWEVKQLKDIFTLKNGFSFKGEFFSNKGPIVLTPGNFKLEGGLYFETRNIKRYIASYPKGYEFKKGDLVVVMTDLTPDCNILGKPAFIELEEQVLHNQRIGKITQLAKNWESRFLYYTLLSPVYLSKIKNAATGSTVRHTSPGTIASSWVPEPQKKEQTTIANALSDVDALISELEKLIAKKQAIKTATMQQLLTGRTRLPQFALREDGSKKSTKQSELGEIPEDWEVAPFGNTLAIRHGKNQKAVENPNGTVPIFATGGQIGWADQYLWNKPSVLIGRKGTIDKPRYSDNPFWTVDTLFYSEIKDCANPKFIFYKFCMIDWMQYNEASGVPSLNASTIENVLTSLPLKKEQTAIASILSDMDEEIQSLKQRLSKTRQIKQGMMQELLTGKTRLV